MLINPPRWGRKSRPLAQRVARTIISPPWMDISHHFLSKNGRGPLNYGQVSIPEGSTVCTVLQRHMRGAGVVRGGVGLLIFWVLMTRTLLVKKYVGEITRIYKFPRRFSHVPFIQQALGNVCNFFGPRCTVVLAPFLQQCSTIFFFFFFFGCSRDKGKKPIRPLRLGER